MLLTRRHHHATQATEALYRLLMHATILSIVAVSIAATWLA